MDFSEAIKSGFANYVTFSGRATRSEFWYWVLFVVLGAFATAILDAAMFSHWAPLTSAFELLTVLPSLAVSVRRLHDTDSSGWWLLIGIVPLIGVILLIVLYCRPGTPGDNFYGPDRLKELGAR